MEEMSLILMFLSSSSRKQGNGEEGKLTPPFTHQHRHRYIFLEPSALPSIGLPISALRKELVGMGRGKRMIFFSFLKYMGFFVFIFF